MPSKLQKSKKGSSKTTVLPAKAGFSRIAGSQTGSENNSRCSTPNSNTSSLSVARSSSRIKSKHGSKKPSSVSSRKISLEYEKDYIDDDYVYGSDLELPSDGDDNNRHDSDLSSHTSNDSFQMDPIDELDDDWSETDASTPAPSKMSRPETPEFLPPEEIVPLNLPPGSNDLSIQGSELMQMLGVYEILRRYSNIVRISPFRFEDFCSSITCDEQCTLISEIYSSLMKSLLREEEGNQTWYGPPDMRDSINIGFFLLDSMTWYECVRAYMESDKSDEFLSSLTALNKESFYATKLDERLTILQALADLFLSSNAVREDILKEGNIRYDEHCRYCHK